MEGRQRTVETFEGLQHSSEVLTLLYYLVLTDLPAHSKVPQVGQNKASHFHPRIPVGPNYTWVEVERGKPGVSLEIKVLTPAAAPPSNI